MAKPIDPRARSAEAFMRIDRATLKRNIMPLLLCTVLVILSADGMPIAKVASRIGIPPIVIRIPIGLVTLIYYCRVSFAAIQYFWSLLKKRFYRIF